jgi:hypothetical protein
MAALEIAEPIQISVLSGSLSDAPVFVTHCDRPQGLCDKWINA